MTRMIAAIAGTLAIFLLERVGVVMATRSERGRQWIRNHRIFHPNPISFMRMPMGLVTIALWAAGWEVAAFLWFAFWMITDLTDGNIARSCDLTTESGKWIDPLSDKLLYFPLMIYLAMGPRVLPLFWVVLLVVIDTVGQISRIFVKKKAANSFGKAKTALITIMIILAGIKLLHGNLPFITLPFLSLLTICCTVLAFLSFYCKVVPDIWYANTFTLANFACGAIAIGLVWKNQLLHAFVLVFLGQFFDLFDGRLARKYGSTRCGALFDDIADGTSFGLATSLIIFAGLGSTLPALLLAAAFCACVVVRLIRFLRLKDALPAGIFSGLPSPAGALLAASSALLFASRPALCYLFTIVATIAMVTPVQYRHFAQRIWPTIPNILKISFSVAIIVFVSKGVTGKFFYTEFLSIELFAFTLAILYLVFGREKGGGAPEPGKDRQPGEQARGAVTAGVDSALP